MGSLSVYIAVEGLCEQRHGTCTLRGGARGLHQTSAVGIACASAAPTAGRCIPRFLCMSIPSKFSVSLPTETFTFTLPLFFACVRGGPRSEESSQSCHHCHRQGQVSGLFFVLFLGAAVWDRERLEAYVGHLNEEWGEFLFCVCLLFWGDKERLEAYFGHRGVFRSP